MIIISHLHLDHYGDLASFAYSSFVYHNLNLLPSKIKVYYPDNYNEQELKRYKENSYLSILSYKDNSIITHGNAKLEFLRNIHDIPTYSTKVTVNNFIIVYTSDTGYNEKLIDFSKNADLLICESTFLKEKNKTINHLYAYEAGLIALKANVKRLMLTHFWPEIDKNEYIKEAKKYFENTIGAKEGQELILRRN